MSENIAELKAAVDLAALVALDLGQPRKKSGRWLFWPCPFHRDKEPSFGVTSDTGHYKCFGCGEAGDHIDWLAKRRNLTTAGVIGELRQVAGLPEIVRAPAPEASGSGEDAPPPEEWQESARAFVDWAAGQLWSDSGAPGLAYLRAGALTDDTIRSWGLGWCPEWKKRDPKRWGLEGKPVWLPRGVVIPCEVAGVLWYLKVRAFGDQGKPEAEAGAKYPQVRDSRTALFGADRFQRDGRPLLLCEGERDCMLAWQELRDLVDVATLGGAGKQDLGRWALWLLPHHRILAAFDPDDAGRKGAAWWADLGRRFQAVEVPHGADLTDFHAAGGDLRVWLAALDVGDLRRRSDTQVADLLREAKELAAEAQAAGVNWPDGYPSWEIWLSEVEQELTGR